MLSAITACRITTGHSIAVKRGGHTDPCEKDRRRNVKDKETSPAFRSLARFEGRHAMPSPINPIPASRSQSAPTASGVVRTPTVTGC